jgi:DNA mismatch endonuclease, patch repair protein
MANLIEGWELARSRGLVHDETPPPESWASSLEVRASMKGNRGRDTGPERRLRALLYARGRRYRVSTRPIPSVRRTADIVFPKARVAVFVDGCYWHGCPKHHRPATTNAEFWQTKITDNKRRDAETNRALEDQGWTVVRCWEHEDPASVVDRVVTLLDDKTENQH